MRLSTIREITIKSNYTEEFVSSNSWGRVPLVMRRAFLEEAGGLGSLSSPWPDWDDVLELSENEEAEIRLITHNPSNNRSWRLIFGPLVRNEYLFTEDSKEKWTIVANDCDRFYSSLSDWVGEKFSIIPQWRRDDAQISLANKGGGIGPHVDDYDVFLIQMAGSREWQVGKRLISSKEELNGLTQGLDIRILDFWHKELEKNMVAKIILEPGDVLYLPPRFGHCGIAASDRCMTLSVGCRAPSAKEMLTKFMDTVTASTDGPLLYRYTDIDLFDIVKKDEGMVPQGSNEINTDVKKKSKDLIRNAINSYLDNENFFDSFYGKLVTETKRLRFDYPVAISDLDDDSKSNLGIWALPDQAIDAVCRGDGILYTAEAVAWAYSLHDDVCKLFVDGKEWRIILTEKDDHTMHLIRNIISARQFNNKMLTGPVSPSLRQALESMISLGYLYGSN